MNKITCNIDIETRSKADLWKVGGYKYAQDKSTHILCYSYKFSDDPLVHSVIGERIPDDLKSFLSVGGVIKGWNINGFDVPVWNKRFKDCQITNTMDTMDKARAYGRPASLDKCAQFMGLAEGKDEEGYKLMRKLCDMNKHPKAPTGEELNTLSRYCSRDVVLESTLDEMIPDLPPSEKRVADLNSKINDTGILVDLTLCKEAVKFAELERGTLSKRLAELTDGEVTRHTQNARILKWLNNHGAKLGNLKKQTLLDALTNDDVQDYVCREVMEIRLSGAKASTAKFQAAIDTAGEDGRVRGTFVYFGAAATGRFSGRGIQPHNLPRITADNPYGVLADIANGKVESVYQSLSSLLRPMIFAGVGKVLARADYSSIEGRVVAWLADDFPALTEYNGKGLMYERAAMSIFDVDDITKITKSQRQIGKVAELACGFQGGHKAFASMAVNYGVKVSEDRAKKIVKKWREGRPSVVKLWHEVEKCALAAASAKDTVACCGGKVKMTQNKDNGDLWIELPSGRFICLPRFNVERVNGPYGERIKLSYKRANWTPAAGAKEWPRCDTYGGSLVESLAQGIARDLLCYSMLKLDMAGYRIIGHVHDEIILEETDDDSNTAMDDMVQVMSGNPLWSIGLPLNAVGEISWRFGK